MKVDLQQYFKKLYGVSVREGSNFIKVANNYINNYLESRIDNITQQISDLLRTTINRQSFLELIAYYTLGPLSVYGGVFYNKIDEDIRQQINNLLSDFLNSKFDNLPKQLLEQLSQKSQKYYRDLSFGTDLVQQIFSEIQKQDKPEYYVTGLLLAKQPYQSPECTSVSMNIVLSRLSPAAVSIIFPTSYLLFELTREKWYTQYLSRTEIRQRLADWVRIEYEIISRLMII